MLYVVKLNIESFQAFHFDWINIKFGQELSIKFVMFHVNYKKLLPLLFIPFYDLQEMWDFGENKSYLEKDKKISVNLEHPYTHFQHNCISPF